MAQEFKNYIDDLVGSTNLEEFYDIYLHVQSKYRENENIKKYIIKKSVKKHHDAKYKCEICDREFKMNYKFLHLKSKEHIKNLAKTEGEGKKVEPVKEDNKEDIILLAGGVGDEILPMH